MQFGSSEIEILSLEMELINSIVHPDSVRCDLIQTWLNLKSICSDQQLAHINGYTDGSVNFKTPSRNNQVIIGTGWIIPEVNISFGAATTLWPSSTKAEL